MCIKNYTSLIYFQQQKVRKTFLGFISCVSDWNTNTYILHRNWFFIAQRKVCIKMIHMALNGLIFRSALSVHLLPISIIFILKISDPHKFSFAFYLQREKIIIKSLPLSFFLPHRFLSLPPLFSPPLSLSPPYNSSSLFLLFFYFALLWLYIHFPF